MKWNGSHEYKYAAVILASDGGELAARGGFTGRILTTDDTAGYTGHDCLSGSTNRSHFRTNRSSSSLAVQYNFADTLRRRMSDMMARGGASDWSS
jgi:hypothetical protein